MSRDFRVYRRVGILLLSTLSVGSVGIIAGCSQTPTDPQSPRIAGVIQSIYLHDAEGQLLVSGVLTSPPDQTGTPGLVLLNASSRTQITVGGSGRALHGATVQDLSVGDSIKAVLGGTVLQSQPPQYGAVRIEAITGPGTR